MNKLHLEAIHLPIVPPMDLNSNMPGIDSISPFPMRLRTRAGVGLFGTRRGGDNGHIRMHEAVDLLYPKVNGLRKKDKNKTLVKM